MRPLAAVVALLMVSSCGGSTTVTLHSPSPRVVTSSPSSAQGSPNGPVATVVAYYDDISRHDTVAAAALLAPSVRAGESSDDGDLTNIATLRNIRDVRSGTYPTPGDLPAGYADITQVSLTYDATFHQVITSDDGSQTRFVYVGRDPHTGGWLILGIGTGP